MRRINLFLTAIFVFTITIFFGCDGAEKQNYLSESARTLMTRIEKNTVLEATREYIPENPNSKDILKNYYKIDDPKILDDFCILLPSGKNISEIAIFNFSTEEARLQIETAVENRKENIVSVCKALYPAKVSIAESGEILKFSNATIMIITPNNNETVKNIIDNKT